MIRLAWRTLARDRLRLLTSVLGVVFASVLMNLQVGMLLGFVDTITSIVRRSPGDLWIVARGTKNVEMCVPQPERRHYRALSTEGVDWSARLIVDFTQWQTPDGRSEKIIVVGIDPSRPVGLPGTVDQGDPDGIWSREGVVVDRSARERLGGDSDLQVGDTVEINGHRARVVGFSREVRSFTTAPYVFTNLSQARDYGPTVSGGDEVKYVVVGVAPGYRVEDVRERLQGRLTDVEVLTRDEMMLRSVRYWLLGTGVGVMSLLTAALGLIVGGAIVGQQVHARTVERTREYGVLKALGCSNRELAMVVLAQALITAALGYVVGVGIALVLAQVISQGKLLVLMNPAVICGLGLVTAAACVVASLTSVRRVMRLEPAVVFGG